MRQDQAIDIPNFFLFGEPAQSVAERYLHLEPLSDRSRPNNWNIRTHSHAELSHIFYITGGAGQMRAEDRRHDFRSPAVLLVPAGVARGFQFQPESEGQVLTISDHYLKELILRQRAFAPLFDAPMVLGLVPGGLDPFFAALARELVWITTAQAAVVEAHLLCILVACARARDLEEARSDGIHPGAQALLAARFREMVEQHYRQAMPLSRYASLLSVSERQLRSACLRIAGQPPSHLIQMRLLLEAKRALLYSNMTVAEAAYYLGFRDPAYFSRFFARAAGRSPRAFRRHKI